MNSANGLRGSGGGGGGHAAPTGTKNDHIEIVGFSLRRKCSMSLLAPVAASHIDVDQW
jgi:hypothetical protein